MRRQRGFGLFFAAPLMAALFFSSLAASCATSGKMEKPSPDYSTIKGDELKALAVTDPEACLEAISLIAISPRSDPGLDTASLSDMALEATQKIIATMDAEVASKQTKDAERGLASIWAIALAQSPVFEKAAKSASAIPIERMAIAIDLARAQAYYEKGLYSPAAAFVLRSLEEKDALDARIASEGKSLDNKAPIERAPIDKVLLAGWGERAIKAGDLTTARRILLYVDGAQAKSLSDAIEELSQGTAISEKAAGVVTVSIDKGLKIEKGVGYPDRILGTAFQVDAQGYYLTNYHVISSEVDPTYNGYSRLSIRPQANPDARIPAKVVGWDEALDLALLKSSEISAHTFYPFKASKVEKGQRVYAIGSPVGLENSVSAGIVSAMGRRILARGDAIQIDVPVNPGNSGGPLLDEKGDLVGLVFAGLSGFQGLNFALPVSWILPIFPALFDGGSVESSWLGMGLAKNLDSSLDVSYALPSVNGVEQGDKLLAIDGKSCKDIQEAQMILAKKPLGSLCLLTLSREGKNSNLLLKTRAAPIMPFKNAAKSDIVERLLGGATGMMLEHVSGPRGLGGTYKVLKTWPGMAADESGIGEADVLDLLRYSVDFTANTMFFDVRVKSLNSGYLERAMRMNLSLEMDNFI